MRIRSRTVAIILIASASITASGCGSQDADIGSDSDSAFYDSPEAAHIAALERGDTLLADALEDGEISRREYELLYHRDLECYLDSGLAQQTGETIWDPISNLTLQTPLDYREEPATEGEGRLLNECTDAFLYPDLLFQTSNEPRMNDDLLAYVRDCLEQKGFETQEDATWLGDLVGPDASQLPNHTGIDECVKDGAGVLYPELQVIGIAY